MDDLISREALVNDLCEDREEGTFYFTNSQAEAADKIIVYVTKRINAQPSVPAVPLDTVCEMLDKSKVTVPCNDDCEGCEAFDGTGDTVNCWKVTLAKWMEEQDADN